VQQVQSATTAASQNQEVPFDQVVSRLLKDRDMSRHPLVQVTFVLHPQANFGQLHLEGLRAEHLHLPQVTRLDLEFHLYPGDGCLQGDILYSADLFNPETIRTLRSVFYDVLSEGLCDPDIEIGSLLLTDAYPVLDQRGLIYTAHEAPFQGCSIIDMFHQQVAAHGDQMAIKDTHTQLTYSELDRRSAMLATWLKNSFSFVEETPVGVFGNRSCESIVAILGILKAGLAYVPLDADAPPQRTEMILSCLPSCQLVLLVSGLMAPPTLPSNIKFAYVSNSSDVKVEEVDAFLTHTPTPRATNLAYIVFTSGTTGTPKGVMVEHRGVVRLAKDPEIVAHTRDFKVASHVLNPAFDASGFEVYATLLNGGTLVCIDKNVVWDYAALGATLVKHGVQRAFFTTAMLKQCLLSAPYIMTDLEILYVGGDKLDPHDMAVARRFGKVRIFNVYGPTENSVVSTRYAIPDGEAAVNGMPIGRSIAGSGAYVMDPNLRLVPIGAMGELVVTGLGLARGYTNPEQNIGRFVTVSIGGQAVHAYRTGDMVRYRPSDAQLEFFGRMDQQVKIRGYRVELAEIDNALTLNGLVSSAVTVLQAQEDQEQELVSFVTIEDTAPDVENLVEHISNAHVNSWKDHAEGDDHYGKLGAVDPAKLGRDFLGWVSMYDGEAIDTEVMAEWLEDTTAAIHMCDPTSALEIGTGTGMILFNLIDTLKEYYGLEPSHQAVEFVQRAVQCVPNAASKVRIQQGTASALAGLKATGPIDLAIVNSVAQYFPSTKYITRVIKQLIQLHDVNCIFFGDIRSYGLYEEFQASKVLHLYGHTLSASEFSQKMAEIVQLEKELLIDPAFFTALATEFPQLIEHVEIMPKRMKTTNELSCYRYTAILHIRHPGHSLLVHEVEQSSWLDFEASGLDYRSLTQMLKTSNDVSVLAFSNIPFKKTIMERHVVNFLRHLPTGAGSTGWSMDVCQQAQVCPAIDVTELVDLAQQTGWQVEVSWARQHSQRGGLDAIFHRLKPEDNGSRVFFQFPTDHGRRGPSRAFSNDPLALQRNQRIENELMESLRARLPSYMVPKRIQVLDRMPINNIGKVDRQALAKRIDIPPPARVLTARSSPRNNMSFTDDIERAMWEEFAGVLGVEVGITDSFFDCGGHSLMAIKLVSRINKRLQSTVPVSDLFQYPSISRLAERVRGSRAPSNSTVSYQPFSLLPGSLSRLPSIDSPHGSEPHRPSTEIIDMLPVTETQAWFLADWSQVSHSFRIEGALDVDGLRAACQAVVQHHATLRTVFTKLLGRLVQVICGSVDAPFAHVYTDGDLESECRSLCAADGGAPSGLTTGFTLLSRSSIEHIFILQFSHAQYDGISLSSILSDLAAAYAGSAPLPTTAPFSGYVHVAALSRSAALDFWKKYLEGSMLTTLRPSNTAINAGVVDLTREAVGKLHQLADITFPTIVNAAIAITLAGLVKRNDVTFACVMSSRGVLSQGAESVQGPCVNRTLIRVQLSPDSTALGFCRGLRENQARVSAQNHLELGDVMENCASWSSSDRLAPWVTHLPADKATSTLALPGACVTYRSTDVRISPRNQILVRSVITDQQQACIQVQVSSTVMDGSYAFSLASKILNTAQALSMSAERTLRSIDVHE
jgi:amino acid adenylation domain-containing protein